MPAAALPPSPPSPPFSSFARRISHSKDYVDDNDDDNNRKHVLASSTRVPFLLLRGGGGGGGGDHHDHDQNSPLDDANEEDYTNNNEEEEEDENEEYDQDLYHRPKQHHVTDHPFFPSKGSRNVLPLSSATKTVPLTPATPSVTNIRPPLKATTQKTKKKKRRKSSSTFQRVANKSIQLSTQMAWQSIQLPGKVAYHLLRPKHVEAYELQGLWRLDQQITVGPGKGGERSSKSSSSSSSGTVLASVATVEIDTRQRIIIIRNAATNETWREPYTFQKTKWGTFRTEFMARLFVIQGQPRYYGYRGTWQRKLADPKVLKLVGTIYTLRKNRLSKGFSFGSPIGTFVARRRLQYQEDEELPDGEDGDEDEYEVDEEDDDDFINSQNHEGKTEEVEDAGEGEYDADDDEEDDLE